MSLRDIEARRKGRAARLRASLHSTVRQLGALDGLPGGVPSRCYDDPGEAAEAADLARHVVELAAAKLQGRRAS
ncbi:MAG TPA: hypothetical protein DHW14_06700 [Clostridiales bacterium]|nr:hypothetical protein [Clostridiales bacterium]